MTRRRTILNVDVDAAPACRVCGRTDVPFAIMHPRIPPFGTVCDPCESKLTDFQVHGIKLMLAAFDRSKQYDEKRAG